MKPLSLKRSDFPNGFDFGVASSAYQIEGHAFGSAGETHWDSFAKLPGRVLKQHNGQIACNHYHKYEEDLDHIKAAGFDSYRFSTSWARVIPEGVGAVNSKGLDFYDRLTDAILERDLKPHLTLYHWELPQAIAEKGGWTNREIVGWFGEFVEIIGHKLGDRIASIAPINEPWCVSWLSHALGHHAPGKQDLKLAALSMHNVLLAHGRAVEVLRGQNQTNLGCVCKLEWSHPASQTAQDIEAAKLYDAIYNRFFLEAMFLGEYPEPVLKGIERFLPSSWQEDLSIISAPLDWCGINYYTCKRVAHDASLEWPHVRDEIGPLEKTDMGWEIYPQGLSDFLMWVNQKITKGIPLFVTENGAATSEAREHQKLNDHQRISYIDAHLGAAHQAIKSGVPLKGYYMWSLMDNFEWAFGYDKRFGLIHVDYSTLERRPKASYYAVQTAIA